MAMDGGGTPGGGFWSGLGDWAKGLAGSMDFGDLINTGSLALGAYGMNKSLGFQEDQLGLMKQQENRAATAQNYAQGNSLAMALQATTPGTPEHERVKQAIANQTYQV